MGQQFMKLSRNWTAKGTSRLGIADLKMLPIQLEKLQCPNGAPRVFSRWLKISIIWGIIKTEDLKTKFFKILRTEDIIILSFVTIEICCLRLKIWKQHILNLKIRNLVLSTGSPNCVSHDSTLYSSPPQTQHSSFCKQSGTLHSSNICCKQLSWPTQEGYSIHCNSNSCLLVVKTTSYVGACLMTILTWKGETAPIFQIHKYS